MTITDIRFHAANPGAVLLGRRPHHEAPWPPVHRAEQAATVAHTKTPQPVKQPELELQIPYEVDENGIVTIYDIPFDEWGFFIPLNLYQP